MRSPLFLPTAAVLVVVSFWNGAARWAEGHKKNGMRTLPAVFGQEAVRVGFEPPNGSWSLQVIDFKLPQKSSLP